MLDESRQAPAQKSGFGVFRSRSVFDDSFDRRLFHRAEIGGGFGLELALASERGFTGPVNLGNPVEFSMLELAEKVIEGKSYGKSVAEQDEILRKRLLEMVDKITFLKPATPAKK